MEKFRGYKTEVKERIERRGGLVLKKKMEGEENFEIYGRFRKKTDVKTHPHGPTDHSQENAETAISCKGSGPARK